MWNCGFWVNGVTKSSTPGTGVTETELSVVNTDRSTLYRRLAFYDGGALLRDLRPAVSGDVVGFYDMVNDEFLAPAGGAWLSGSLT